MGWMSYLIVPPPLICAPVLLNDVKVLMQLDKNIRNGSSNVTFPQRQCASDLFFLWCYKSLPRNKWRYGGVFLQLLHTWLLFCIRWQRLHTKAQKACWVWDSCFVGCAFAVRERLEQHACIVSLPAYQLGLVSIVLAFLLLPQFWYMSLSLSLRWVYWCFTSHATIFQSYGRFSKMSKFM